MYIYMHKTRVVTHKNMYSEDIIYMYISEAKSRSAIYLSPRNDKTLYTTRKTNFDYLGKVL